jgi:hypothetical protein
MDLVLAALISLHQAQEVVHVDVDILQGLVAGDARESGEVGLREGGRGREPEGWGKGRRQGVAPSGLVGVEEFG